MPAPILKPPPWTQNITGRRAVVRFLGRHTFKYKQSSLLAGHLIPAYQGEVQCGTWRQVAAACVALRIDGAHGFVQSLLGANLS